MGIVPRELGNHQASEESLAKYAQLQQNSTDARPESFSFGRRKSRDQVLPDQAMLTVCRLTQKALYSKLDWVLWTATLTDNQADFVSFLAPAYKFTNDTLDRLPLTDFYDTDTGKHRVLQARSIVGGIFIKMLADHEVWKKWPDKRFHSTRHQRNLVFCRNSVPGA